MILCAVLVPETTVAQRRCDGGGQLTNYLLGTSDGPAPSAVADVWLNGAVPKDVDRTSLAALREAIEAFERQRPRAAQAAEIASGDWVGWRAALMSRDDFVHGFFDEVGRRARRQDDYAAILQAAQAMRNKLDNMHGAAGIRERLEVPSVMWLWDLHLRTPGAEEELNRLNKLPDEQWLWGRYSMGRKTAIACALDDMSTQKLLAATVDPSLFRQPGLLTELAAGRKVPLDFATMVYLGGLLEYRLPKCKWAGSAVGLASVVRFQQATTQSVLNRMFEIQDVEYGCNSPTDAAISKGLVRTLQVNASASSDSLFVQSCSVQGLSLKQCACLAELGRGVAPKIERMAYDRRSTIKSIVERNPLLGVQIGVECGISNY